MATEENKLNIIPKYSLREHVWAADFKNGITQLRIISIRIEDHIDPSDVERKARKVFITYELTPVDADEDVMEKFGYTHPLGGFSDEKDLFSSREEALEYLKVKFNEFLEKQND